MKHYIFSRPARVVLLAFVCLMFACQEPSEDPEEEKCISEVIPPCSSGTSITSDQMSSTLIGTWHLQKIHYQLSAFINMTAEPYPDTCNMDLIFNSDMTYKFMVGDNLKQSGFYSLGLVDININNTIMHWSPPPYPTDYRVYLTVSPDLSIDELRRRFGFSVPLSGFLNLSSACMEVYQWSSDRHGYETTLSASFVKAE